MAVYERGYLGSITLVPTLEPTRFYYGSVFTQAVVGNDVGYNGSVYLSLTISGDKSYTGSVVASDPPGTHTIQYTGTVVTVTTVISGQAYTGSVHTVVSLTNEKSYFGSVKTTAAIEKDYTGSVVVKQNDTEKTYTGSVIIFVPPEVSYEGTVVAQGEVDRSYTGSVRPVVKLSPVQEEVRDTAVDLLIEVRTEEAVIAARIATDTARAAYLLAEAGRLEDIIIDLDEKPSTILNSISQTSGLLSSGGETLSCFGDKYIPGAEVELWQDSTATNIGTFSATVVSQSELNFTTPDFSSVGGLNLSESIQIKVVNFDSNESETLSFTLA
jgi:hypothetical protein